MHGDLATAERGLIYARASQDKSGEGTSVDKQIERGLKFVKDHQVQLICPPADVQDRNASAMRSAKERPGFKKVLAYIRRDAVDVLILWEVSRGSRDMEEGVGLLNACTEHGVKIVIEGHRYDPSNPGDRMSLMQQMIMAEFEGMRIAKRNVDSVKTNAERGTPHGRLPYGYRRIYDPRSRVLRGQTPWMKVDAMGEPVLDEKGDWVPVFGDDKPNALNPEAQVIHDAVHGVIRGETLRGMCRDLNERGIDNPRQASQKTLAENPAGVVREWSTHDLRQRIRNPTMAGRRVYQGQDNGEASWDPIVPYDVWLQMEGILSNPARRTVKDNRGSAPRHLLPGIARCGECGAFVKHSNNNKRSGPTYVCRAEKCFGISIVKEPSDRLVTDMVKALLARPDYRGAITMAYRAQMAAAEQGPDIAAQIAAVEAAMDGLDAQRDRGEFESFRAYDREMGRLERQRDDLKAQEVVGVTNEAIRRLLEAETLVAGWEAEDLYGKRDVLRALLDITIVKPVKGAEKIERFERDRVQMEPSAFLRSGLEAVAAAGRKG